MSQLFYKSQKVKELFTLIEKIAYRHNSYGETFSDILDFTIGCFLVEGNKPLAEHLQAKYTKEYDLIKEAFKCLIYCYNDGLNIPEQDGLVLKFAWTDPLGAIYEELSSKYKKSNLGQFFTPEHVCTFMACITIDDKNPGKNILEPCSGSGRMVLAANSVCPGNTYYCIDLDPVCTKMTTINMLMHGMIGETCCGNSLYLIDNYNFGYKVNPHLLLTGVPTLLPLAKEESYLYNSDLSMFSEKKQENIPNFTTLEIKQEKIINSQQLTLF